MQKFLFLLIAMAAMLGIIGIAVFAVRWARKSSKRAAFLGWGLQFLGAGMNPEAAIGRGLRNFDNSSRDVSRQRHGDCYDDTECRYRQIPVGAENRVQYISDVGV
jgi:hypothetical protein